ncbi:NfeD family protein, partial [Burkholderia lata]
ERWRVASSAPLAAGCRVRVTGRHGLLLTVAPLYDVPGQEHHQEQHQGEPS